MTKLAFVMRASMLALFCAICSGTAALADCPPDCGGLAFKFQWNFGEGAEVRVGYDSMALMPITYDGDRLGTASYGVAAEFVQPIRLSDLSAGDIIAILRDASLEVSINEFLTSSDMHDSRFRATGNQFLGLNLYDALNGTADPDYGARFDLDITGNFGGIDVAFPLIGIRYDGTDGRTYSYGLAPSLRLFGEKTPGACSQGSADNCFTFSRGDFSFRALNIPEAGAWTLMTVGFVFTGAAVRASRRRLRRFAAQ